MLTCPKCRKKLYYRKKVDAWVCKNRQCRNYFNFGKALRGVTFDESGEVKKTCLNCIKLEPGKYRPIKNKWVRFYKCNITGESHSDPQHTSCDVFDSKVK